MTTIAPFPQLEVLIPEDYSVRNTSVFVLPGTVIAAISPSRLNLATLHSHLVSEYYRLLVHLQVLWQTSVSLINSIQLHRQTPDFDVDFI